MAKIRVMEASVMPSVLCMAFTDLDKMRKFYGKKGLSLHVPERRHLAFTNAIHCDDELVICLFIKPDIEDRWQYEGLLAHEAVHGAFMYFDEIGEKDQGEEELAYVVQSICGAWADILGDYEKW